MMRCLLPFSIVAHSSCRQNAEEEKESGGRYQDSYFDGSDVFVRRRMSVINYVSFEEMCAVLIEQLSIRKVRCSIYT